MTPCDRESVLLLISGWAIREPAGWRVLDASHGDGSAWTDATPEDAAALDATLAALPAVASIYAAIVERGDGHRGGCAALRFNRCTCRPEPAEAPHRIVPLIPLAAVAAHTIRHDAALDAGGTLTTAPGVDPATVPRYEVIQ